MRDKLREKVAIVTGSGRGLGRAIALALAREGASVVTNDISQGVAEATSKAIMDIGGQSTFFTGDVSSFKVTEKLVGKAISDFGRLDILINNAGTPDLSTTIWDIGEEDWDKCLGVFLKGSFNCIRHACGRMREQGWGRIVNTTSCCWLGIPPHCAYSAAKAGIVGLTRAVARDVGRYGITCNVYAPNAATSTVSNEAQSFIRQTYEAGFLTKERYEEFLNPPSPDTVGPLVAYLCTEEAGDINGQIFDVWGGKISIYSEPERVKSIYKEKDLWTVEELIENVPKVLLEGYVNPAPVKPDK